MRISRILLLIAAAVAAAIVFVAVTIARSDGFSARTDPTPAERLIARTARRWAVPRAAITAVNPVPFSESVWAESRAHFADHCASCHANDGSGQTALGRNLSPRVPDMRLADTQNLSDGELYWLIENGVRLTGMPAWGTGGPSDADTWKLVHFIRHLKDLTPEHLKEMGALNPKTPGERQEEQDDERFLSGDDTAPVSPAGGHHH